MRDLEGVSWLDNSNRQHPQCGLLMRAEIHRTQKATIHLDH